MFPLALLNAASPPSPPVDPGLTLALLHFDGANNSTVFTDSSPYNKTITIHSGTPTNSSDNAEVGFGNRGKFFGGSSIRVLPTSDDFDLAFSDTFTLETRFEVPSLGGYQGIICDAVSGGAASFFLILDADNSNKLSLLFKTTTTTYVIRHDTLPTINTKNHVAVVRNNGFLDLYFNGVRASTRAVIGNEPYKPYTSHLTIGVLGDAALYPLNGYVDELRIRKEAVYTGNFTPPTAPFTYVDYNTVLWLKFEGANGSTIFTDSSSQNNTITRYGSPSITTSNSKFGNSCLGINANSYLKINRSESFDIGAGQPFTIQMWLYITGGTGASGGLISMRDAPVYCPIEVNITNNGTLATKIGNATLTDWGLSSFTMSTYVWRHFAIVGDGSLIKLYNHGVRQGEVFAQPHWPNDEYLLQINRNGDNQMQSCANIDHLSFHKTALWLSDFTPPTSEFTY